MWRWSRLRSKLNVCNCVFSTYVEVIPITPLRLKIGLSILHVCGGDPLVCVGGRNGYVYSPRMWRWSPAASALALWARVFSTYVEVIPDNKRSESMSVGILHVCGGDPSPWPSSFFHKLYSPRMWRWSHDIRAVARHIYVFSTYVEVILTDLVGAVLDWGILHTCWECYCPWAHR